jgi:hypothetical protein
VSRSDAGFVLHDEVRRSVAALGSSVQPAFQFVSLRVRFPLPLRGALCDSPPLGGPLLPSAIRALAHSGATKMALSLAAINN